MHMTGGEIFTRAQEVTECFVSVGNDDVSIIIDRYRSTSEPGSIPFLQFNSNSDNSNSNSIPNPVQNP